MIKKFILKNKKTLSIILVFILLIILIIIFRSKYKAAKLEINRLKNNVEALQTKDNSGLIHDQYLTKDEFKDYYSKLVKYLSDVEKDVKAKQIQNVTHISNYYIDSSNVYYTANEVDTNSNVYDISYNDSCWGFSGIFNKINNNVSIFSRNFSNELYLYEYWKRSNLFGWSILPKWGKKEYYRKAWTSCDNDTTIIKKIHIIKKKDFNNN